jgi:flagella basal body P-ring formation protein FlgA
VIASGVSTVKLRPQVTLSGEHAKLADVLTFGDADARLVEAIGSKPIVDSKAAGQTGARVSPIGPTNEVTHEQIVARLDELGVNMARVLVGGASVCRVSYVEAKPEPRRPAQDRLLNQSGVVFAAAESPLIREGSSSDGSRSLSDVLRRLVQDDLAEKGGTVEVEFEVAGREFLALTTPPFEFSVNGGRGNQLGLREFKVTIRRDGRTQRTVRIGANVKLVRQVLVASKPLNIGSYVTRDSVESAARIFTGDEDLGIQQVEQIVGQQTQQFVPAGQMIRIKDIKAVDMVKRSRPVTVEGGGAVSVRLTGVALDNGGYGETVRVRLGDSRKDRREIRGVVTGVGMVRMAEE